ncbi:MAG: hypothetical protein WCJ91_06730 [Actinomycetes bacterium]
MQLNRKFFGTLAAVASSWLSAPGKADAQSVPGDVRMIRPDIMVLLDSSGSMEFRTNTLNNTCSGTNAHPDASEPYFAWNP